jgi:uncharacterized protein DUF5679
MESMTAVLLAVFILVVLITLFALVFRLLDLESRLAEVPEQGVRTQPVDSDWLVEGYCVKDRKRVEMIHPHPVTMANGRPAMAGVCPHCGTKIYKIGKSYGVVQAIFRVHEDHERLAQGRREMA